MISHLNLCLKATSDWGGENRDKFNGVKTQTCLLSGKGSAFHLNTTLRGESVIVGDHLKLIA